MLGTSTLSERINHGCRKNSIGGELLTTSSRLRLVIAQALASAHLAAGRANLRRPVPRFRPETPRRLQYDTKARIQLEPKDSMPARGLPSPDRADAIIGAAAPLVWLGFSGAVTADRLAGTRFGGLSGSRTLFDCEPVTFE